MPQKRLYSSQERNRNANQADGPPAVEAEFPVAGRWGADAPEGRAIIPERLEPRPGQGGLASLWRRVTLASRHFGVASLWRRENKVPVLQTLARRFKP